MIVTVAGLPNIRSDRTLINVEEVVSERTHPVQVERISDAYELCKLGVIQTPSVLVNHKLKVAGRIPNMHEIERWLDEELVLDEAV